MNDVVGCNCYYSQCKQMIVFINVLLLLLLYYKPIELIWEWVNQSPKGVGEWVTNHPREQWVNYRFRVRLSKSVTAFMSSERGKVGPSKSIRFWDAIWMTFYCIPFLLFFCLSSSSVILVLTLYDLSNHIWSELIVTFLFVSWYERAIC